MADETTNPLWPQPQAPYSAAPATPAPTPAEEDDESTGVENVGYGAVTNFRAPINPSTRQGAQREALTVSTDGAGYSASNYAELIEQLQQRMDGIKPLTKEERKKLERKQRTEGIISGIADAATAMSNLFFTTQYAPNMYNAKEGMSAKARERFDKAKAQRDADDDRYMKYALQLGKARDAVDAMRDRRQQQGIQLQLKLNDDARRQAKAQHDAAAADIDLQMRAGRLTYEEARARKAAADARLAEAYAEHADEKVIAEINRANHANQGRSRGGSHSNFRIRRRKPDGTYEIRDGFRSAAEARNYVGTHSDEGWEYATTPVRTERTDALEDRTVTVRDESSTRDVSTRETSNPQQEPWSLRD